jgi:hypothetical protein
MEEIVIIITKVEIETNQINIKINIKIQIIINHHKIIVSQDKIIKVDNNLIIRLQNNSIHRKKDINKNNIKEKDNKIKDSQDKIKHIRNHITIEINKDKILYLNKEIKEIIRIHMII